MEILSRFNGTITVMLFSIAAYLLTIPLRWTLNFLPMRARRRVQGPLGDAVQIVIVLSAALFGARYAKMDITILLAIVAIFTAGVSLAMDTSVRDVIASVKLMAFGYYSVGDHISIKDYTGKVINVSLFATSIYVASKGLVTLSNSKISESDIVNHSRVPVELTVRIPVAASHEREIVASLLRARVAEIPGILVGSIKTIHAWETGCCEVYTIKFKVEDYEKRHEISSAVSIGATNELEANEIGVGEVTFYRES